MMEYNFWQIIIYFITYAFLGWSLESVYRSICERKIINSGFLLGPFCPIYGVGAIIMLMFLERFSKNIMVLFLISIIVLTVWEYLVGILLEKMFNTKYWDYSNNKFNYKGRICLLNSIYWGVLGVIFVKLIHPFIENIISQIDNRIIIILYSILMISILIDMIVSIIKVKNLKVTLEKIEKLNLEIREKIKYISEEGLIKKEQTTEILENVQKMILKLKRKRYRRISNLYKNVYRLKRAFPAINTVEISEILSKKVELNQIKNELKKKILKRKDKI